MNSKLRNNTNFKNILDNLPISIIVFDKNGKILLVNNKFIKTYKYFKKDIINKKISDFINLEFSDFLLVLYENKTLGVPFYDKSKTKIFSEIDLLSNDDEDYIIISIKSIKTYEDNFNKFNIYDLNYKYNLHKTGFNISYFNLKTLEIKSMTSRKFPELNVETSFERWLTFVHPDDVNVLVNGYEQYKNGFEVAMEYRIKGENSSDYLHVRTIGEIVDWDENFPIILAISEDITQKKKTELELRENNNNLILLNENLEESRSTMIEVISKINSELKKPIDIITTAVNKLNQNSFSAHNVVLLELIENSSKTLSAISQNMSNISKIDFGIFRLQNNVFDFYTTLNYLKEVIDIKSKENNTESTFCTNIKDNIKVNGDEEKFKIIMTNIIENAFLISKNKKTDFIITTKELNKKLNVKIKVCSSILNTIIDLENFFHNNSIFDTYKIDSAKISQGLGLSLTKELIKVMNGEVSFIANEKSDVSFILELNFDIHQYSQDNYTEQLLYRKDKEITILGIDDNLLAQETLEIIMAEININYIPLRNRNEVFKVLDDNSISPDLIIISLDLLNINGFELLKNIREEYKFFRNLPVVGMTSFPHIINAEKNKESGIIDCIYKPFEFEEFKKCIIKNTLYLL